ncbi:MAG: S-ribosylhomocysteine lyase [Vallitaleaceae bacterium]|jgi:S-ribosylhomocysteine lyase|nr:S-ribosylhomocysteine lyase [Vallitaleaceae bacterium]
MDKIPSFTVNHIDLLRGVYVSRKDQVGTDDAPQILTTFDIRMTLPNREPVINTAEIHAIEHLGATFLRNSDTYKDQVIYFGPMGCRTGFYLIMKGDLSPKEIIPLLVSMFQFIADFTGDIPGATARDCGNFRDMNLPMARLIAKLFLENTLIGIDDSQMIYPE